MPDPASIPQLLFDPCPPDGRERGPKWVQQLHAHVYRYLLYLTGNPDTAEDLTQETFVQAWRNLPTFEGRAPFQHWLIRIAHREFLQSLRRRRSHLSLDQIPDSPCAQSPAWTDAADLRALIGDLPVQEREVIILHYFEGYPYEEISRIVGAPVGRVRHRLSEGRARLRQQIGGEDLNYLNCPYLMALCRWAWLPLDELADLEAGLRWEGQEGRDACATPREAEILDSRLDRKVSIRSRGVALADLCTHLQAETGIGLSVAPTVADTKVTLLCRERSLRTVMRAVASLFGFTWQRNRVAGAYCYELVQEHHARLLQEALRLRDHHSALLALDSEMQRYRRLLALSPAEAAQARLSATPEKAPLLENLAGPGWAAVQIYFRLSPAALAALHTGQRLIFSQNPTGGQWPLSQEIAQGALATFPYTQLPPDCSEVPEQHLHVLQVDLSLTVLEPGQVRLEGNVLFSAQEVGSDTRFSRVTHVRAPTVPAVGISRSLQSFGNRPANLPRLKNSILQRPMKFDQEVKVDQEASSLESTAKPGDVRRPHLTTADLLETLYLASGHDILADYFTCLYPPDAVTLPEVSLQEAVNALSETMRLRWCLEDDWLQFRSAGFVHDQVAEVPHRLLSRWAARRSTSGRLSFEDLIEIARLSDTQLDAPGMAAGAQTLYGLEEWDLVRSHLLRPHWRFLGSLPPELASLARSEEGLKLEDLPASQRQEFLALATCSQETETRQYDLALGALREVLAGSVVTSPLWKVEDLSGATLHLLRSASETAEKEIAFLYRYGNTQMGYWMRDIRFDYTHCQHDAFHPFPLTQKGDLSR